MRRISETDGIRQFADRLAPLRRRCVHRGPLGISVSDLPSTSPPKETFLIEPPDEWRVPDRGGFREARNPAADKPVTARPTPRPKSLYFAAKDVDAVHPRATEL